MILYFIEKKRLPKEQPTNTTFIATDELLSAQWYSGIPANSTNQAPNKYAKSKTRESKRTMLASNPLPLPIATTIIPVRSHTPYPIYFSDGSSRKGNVSITMSALLFICLFAFSVCLNSCVLAVL